MDTTLPHIIKGSNITAFSVLAVQGWFVFHHSGSLLWFEVFDAGRSSSNCGSFMVVEPACVGWVGEETIMLLLHVFAIALIPIISHRCVQVTV